MAPTAVIKKTILYPILKPIFAVLKLTFLYVFDLYEYAINSGAIFFSKESVEAKISELSHSIERGLSLKNTKKNFGIKKINMLNKYMQSIPQDNYSCVCAASTLNEYLKQFPNNKLDCNLSGYEKCETGGVLEIDKKHYFANTKTSFDTFSNSRYSVRDFSTQNVDLNLVLNSIKIAQKSPSACNRQPARLYIVLNQSDILKILTMQGGANGFKEYVNKLIIITSDLSAYLYASERNLWQLDSGMFGMSLLYALHFNEIAACPLMWINSPRNDKIIKSICNIKKNHRVVFLVAIGHLPDKLSIAKSPRKFLESIVYIGQE